MHPSRRTRTSPRALALFLSVTFVAAAAYALAQRSASAARAPQVSTLNHKSRAFVPGEILVRFRGESKAAAARQELTALRAADGRTIPVALETPAGLQVVRGLSLARVSAADTLAAVESLRALPEVLYAEPNYVRRKFATPNDPSFASQWALKNTGQSGGVSGADIDAEPAWNTTTGSSQVVVGVVDEGVDINHPDLQPNVWTNPAEVPGNGVDDDGSGFADDVHGWDFFHNDATVFDAAGAFPSDETDAHGTHVAGIIGAAGNNGQGVSGVNWNVKLLPIKILGQESESAAPSSVLLTVRAYGYAKTLRDLYNSSGGAKGANLRVLNNSYGGYGESQAERDAIRALGDAGVLFVVSSGNDGRSNDKTPLFPAGYNEPNLITVGATTRHDNVAVFSNYSPRHVHMAAPGQEILSTTPGGTYAVADGTSMAAPHVAGAAALVCAADPSVSVARLRAALLYSGEQLQSLTPQSDFFGARGYVTGRRLNAANAVGAAFEADSAPPAEAGNFRVTSQEGRTLNLEWTAPGDDGAQPAARASLYEIRFTDTDPRLLDSAQYQRSLVLFAPLPANPGTAQTARINVPFRHPSGFVGIRAVDNVGNAGPVSAVAVTVEQDTSDPYTLSTAAPEPLSTGGEKLDLVGDDLYSSSPYQLPFDFTFFGQTGRGLYLSTNGALYFGDPPRTNIHLGFPVPDDFVSSVPRLAGYRMIAALWDDLRTNLRTGGDVYVVKPDPTRIIFRWQGTTFFSPNGGVGGLDENPVNFEVELRRDGTIVKRYGAGNNFVFPVVGISGGDPDTYVAATHTSEFSPVNLSNAQTIVYTPRRPTPDPTPDVSVNMLATPNPATSGGLLTYQLEASNRSSDFWAEQTRVTTQVPAGTTLVSVTASPASAVVSAPTSGATSGTITIDYGTLFPHTFSGTATITVRVDSAAGSTVTNTATIRSYWQGDSDPSNNTATVVTQVVESPAFNGVRALAAGGMSGNNDGHTVALKNDGTVWAWGNGLQGQLGDGINSVEAVPALTLDITNVAAVAAGGIHTLAVKSDGTVWAWGNNQYGQLGVQDQSNVIRTRPVQLTGLSGFVAVAAGFTHSVALKSDGTVWAWGANGEGQVGTGNFTQPVQAPVQVAGLSNVKAIAAGPNYSLAVKTDGTVWGWGSNSMFGGPPAGGVLGLQNASSTGTPVQIAGLSNVASVAAGGYHAVALKSDGTLVSWGNNQYGQLGDNGGASSPTPRAVSGLSNVAAVAAGLEHALALKSDGTVWAWGRNFSGQVGDNTKTNRAAPVPVALGASATAIAAGTQHSGAVLADGSVRTWGSNTAGQLGDRTRIDRAVPVPVVGAFPVATPIITPDGGSFEFRTHASIRTETEGATIRYTTNGADPTESDPAFGFSDTVIINATTTLKARAFKPGWPASAVKTATFTKLTQPTPTPVPGAAGQPLAVVRQVSAAGNNGADIFLVNPDGTAAVNLTNTHGEDQDPDWSPDGTRLAYTCQRNPEGGYFYASRVCVSNPDGTGFKVVSGEFFDAHPTWSPDGRQLAVTNYSGMAAGIQLMDADGANRRPLNVDLQGASQPDWSPDGQRIVVNVNFSIWVSRVGVNDFRRLTQGTMDSRPRYSPDGAQIAFQRMQDGQPDIFVMNADGSGVTRLTTHEGYDVTPDWSPDGSKIIFTSNRGGQYEVYSMNPDGTHQTKLTGGYFLGGASWRPAPSPIDGSGFFVAQHYRDFLSREPDADGLAFWTQGIDSCGSDSVCREVKRIDTSAAFFLSIEFQNTGYLVYRTYKAAYGNLPGKPVPLKLAEFTPDTRRIAQGVVVNAPGWAERLESNKQNYFDAFVGDPRFAAAFPATLTPAQFVDALNANAGQVLSAAEREALVGGLTGGTLTRAQVLRAVAEDADLARAEFNRAFVLMQYFGYLRRDPDAAPDADFDGYNFWLGKLDQFGGNYIAAEMVKAFLDSVEYRRRFNAN